MDEIKDAVVAFVHKRDHAVSIEEIAAALLLSPDVVYRAAILLVQEKRLKVDEPTDEDIEVRELIPA